MMYIALVFYIAACSVGVALGSMLPFWYTVIPVVALSGVAASIFAAMTYTPLRVSDRLLPALYGATWGGLAGAFAASTCWRTHAHSWMGSEVAVLVVGLIALALVVIAEMMPSGIASRPHVLCFALFMLTVVLALALGAEVPSWP